MIVRVSGAIAIVITFIAVPVAAQNQILNSGFDVGDSSPGWVSGVFPDAIAHWSPLDANGSPDSGSLEVTVFIGGGARQNVSVVAGATYDLGASVLAANFGAQGWVQVEWREGPREHNTYGACLGASLGTVATPHAASQGVWEAVAWTGTAPPGARCGRVTLAVSTGGAGNPHTANFDDVVFQRTGTTGAFHTLTPCRLVDTRTPSGPLGGPALSSIGERDFPIAGNCGIPLEATAVSANLTVIGATGPGSLKIYPTGDLASWIAASAINFGAGTTRANMAVLTLGVGGMETVRCEIPGGGTADFVVDVNGYFR